MPVPGTLYNKDGEKIWDLKTSKREFDRQSVKMIDRDLFLGTQGDFNKFKKLMNTHQFDCTHPVQIRVMGNVDEVRNVSKKILKVLGGIYPIEKDTPLKVKRVTAYNKDSNKIMTYGSRLIGLSKLECDKKERVGNFCSSTIRAYINPDSSSKRPVCTPR